MNKAEQIERAIEQMEILKDSMAVCCVNNALKNGDMTYPKELEAYDLALEALQQSLEREKNEPLTLEQLKDMAGELIWDDFYKEWHVCDGKYEIEIGIKGRFYKYKKESE